MSSSHLEEKDHFDLLPFIAILMCTLGCLLFVTLSVAALSIGPDRGEGWIVGAKRSDGRQPVLVEWDGVAAVLHRDGRRLKVPWQSNDAELPAPSPATVATAGAGVGPVPLAGVSQETVAGGPGASRQLTFHTMMSWFYENRQTQYVLFAVRPSGFGSFDEFAEEFRTRGIKIGYEPIAQGRAVTLLKGDTPHE